nr:MAG TPA: hypothetical protein [Crassvirales sp.]
MSSIVAKAAKADTNMSQNTVKTTAKVVNVEMFTREDRTDVKIVLDAEAKLPSYTLDTTTGQYIATELNYFSIRREALTAQLCNKCEDIALYRATQESAFNKRQLAVILIGSTIEVLSTPIAAGETDENGNVISEHDTVHRKIGGIKLSQRAATLIDNSFTL